MYCKGIVIEQPLKSLADKQSRTSGPNIHSFAHSNNASRVKIFNIHNSRHNKVDIHTGYTGCKIEIHCTPMVAQKSVGLDSIPAAGMHTAPAPRLRGRSSIERLPPHL
jgi:hypothetical protein